MLESRLQIVCLLAICAPAAFAGVTVTSPANGSTVSGAVSFVASATASSCSKGVASMGIYTAPGVLIPIEATPFEQELAVAEDRKSTRLNSSHQIISYSVFCFQKTNN